MHPPLRVLYPVFSEEGNRLSSAVPERKRDRLSGKKKVLAATHSPSVFRSSTMSFCRTLGFCSPLCL